MLAAVKAAKYLGAKVIVAAGADGRVKAALDLGGDAGVEVVLENIGDPELFAKAFLAIGRGGRLVTVGSHGGGIVPVNVSHLYFNHIAIMGWTGQSDADMNDSLKAASEGRLRVLLDRVMPLAQAVEAHHIVTDRSGLGKVILQPVDERHCMESRPR